MLENYGKQIDQKYSMVSIGNHKHIHINTETRGKLNVWRILTEIGNHKKIQN